MHDRDDRPDISQGATAGGRRTGLETTIDAITAHVAWWFLALGARRRSLMEHLRRSPAPLAAGNPASGAAGGVLPDDKSLAPEPGSTPA